MADFQPVWWASGGLLQTLAATCGRQVVAALQLERVALPDGDFVRLHTAAGRSDQPLVLLLHGLEGSARSPYVAAMAAAVLPTGAGLAVLEFRGCGGEPNRARRGYHSGETGDLGHVVELLRVRWPGRPLALCGWSLGGNVLLKWLGECAGLVPAEVGAAAVVSVPFDLAAAARQCDQQWGGRIARHFLKTLVPKALAKAAAHPGLLDAAAVRRCRSFAAFDDLVTAPLHGFRSAAHYWQAASCVPYLPEVRVPTLLVAAADDPLVPASAWPAAAVAGSPFLRELRTTRGGHCGFVDGGTPWRPQRWAERQVAAFLLQDRRGGPG